MWVSFETVGAAGKRTILEIESNGLCKVNFTLSDKILQLPDKICKICVTDDMIVIHTEDRDFRNGQQSAPWVKDNRQINNVDAYDHNGNYLWNIGSIIGDIKMQIDGIYQINAKEAKKEYGVKVRRKQRNLFICTAGGYLMIIDGTQQKLLLKIAGMVK